VHHLQRKHCTTNSGMDAPSQTAMMHHGQRSACTIRRGVFNLRYNHSSIGVKYLLEPVVASCRAARMNVEMIYDSAPKKRFILGSTDSGRKNCCPVVLRQLLVRFVENNLIFSVLLHTGFQVVALDDSSYTDSLEHLVNIGVIRHLVDGL